MTSFPTRGLYAITDEQLLPPSRFLAAAAAALKGGARVLQYRDKSLDGNRRRTQAEALLRLGREAGVPLIVNDDVALAHQIGADGVHVGADDMRVFDARRLLGAHAIIGASCYASLDRARRAVADGASYVAFGRFFPSPTKPGAAPAPLDILGQARAELGVPVIAIGGITADNGASLLAAGADLLAVVSGVFGTDDVCKAARAFDHLFSP